MEKPYTILRNLSLLDVIKFAPNPLIKQTIKCDLDLTPVKRYKTFFMVDIEEH